MVVLGELKNAEVYCSFI